MKTRHVLPVIVAVLAIGVGATAALLRTGAPERTGQVNEALVDRFDELADACVKPGDPAGSTDCLTMIDCGRDGGFYQVKESVQQVWDKIREAEAGAKDGSA